jgi:hypothetical protein
VTAPSAAQWLADAQPGPMRAGAISCGCINLANTQSLRWLRRHAALP